MNVSTKHSVKLNTLMTVVNHYTCMPIRSNCIRNRKSPWMNSDTLRLIRERVKLKKKAWKNRDEVEMGDYRKLIISQFSVIPHFSQFSNKITFQIRKAKKEDYTDQ